MLAVVDDLDELLVVRLRIRLLFVFGHFLVILEVRILDCVLDVDSLRKHLSHVYLVEQEKKIGLLA